MKKFIIDSLLCGRPLRVIAGTLNPPLSIMALQRYKAKIVRPALSNAVVVAKLSGKLPANGKTIDPNDINAVPEDVSTTAVQTATNALQHAEITDPYLARIAQHQRTIDVAIAKADDGKTIAALIGTDLKGIDLDARLTGRLDHDKPSQNISLAVMVSLPRAIPNVPRPSPSIDVSFSRPAIDQPE